MGKKDRPTGILTLCALAGLLSLIACAGSAPQKSNVEPTGVVYLVGSSPAYGVDTAINGYSTQTQSGSPISTITYPQNYYGGPVATDPGGQLYVAVDNTSGPAGLGEVFVFAPNSTGQAAPSRTIDLSSYDVAALAVDVNGLLYVAISPGTGTPTIAVYSASASGTATPLRTLVAADFVEIRDIAVDAKGNIYAAGLIGQSYDVAVYSPDASGSAAPLRTILLQYSDVSGIAVDDKGDILASGFGGTGLEIEEFAPAASGAATPFQTVSLPSLPPGSAVYGYGGPVRLDAAGNIFTTAQIYDPPVTQQSIVVYGFSPTTSGNATPIVQITLRDGYDALFAVN